MNEIAFEVFQEGDREIVTECLIEPIFSQADTWDQLRAEVKDAVAGYFFDQPQPASIRLQQKPSG